MEQKPIFYRIINAMIRIMLAGAVFLLLLHSMFSTSFVGRLLYEDGSDQERTFNIADSPLRHLLLFVCLSALLFLVRRIWERVRVRVTAYRRVGCGDPTFRFLMVLTLAAGAAFVLLTQLAPASDPAKVYRIAMQWREGDFTAFDEGGYLFVYPFQSGIVLFFYLLSFLFGTGNYVGIQLLYVVCLAVVYGLLAKLSALFWQGKGLQNKVYLGVLLWVPLGFYVTYLYGILPGMALSLGAVYFTMRYLLTRRYRYIAAASLCMGLATVIKMNCLIYLIAIACFLLYDAIDLLWMTKGEYRRKWFVSLLFIVCMGFSVAVCGQLNNRLVEQISGKELAEGAPMISWVVMGLQEAPLGPGGYNGYIGDMFTGYHYDTEQITSRGIEDIGLIMTRMSENPLDEGIPFFARKTAFQWNDPTFICLDRTRGRSSAVAVPLWLRSLIDGRASVGLSVFLNYMQTLILLCALLCILLRARSQNLYELMGAVVFLGGFLFHMVWESSASYTIPYFALLIPYAVCGMAEWIDFLESGLVKIKRGELLKKPEKKKLFLCGAGLAFFLLLAAFTRTNLFDRTIALNDDLQGIDAGDQYYKKGVWERDY